MPTSIRAQHLKIFLLKEQSADFVQALIKSEGTKRFALKSGLGFDGAVFVRTRLRPGVPWRAFVQSGAKGQLGDLVTHANSAVVFVRVARGTFAITFGYGWTMLKPGTCVSNFGIHTALNSVDARALRCIDTHTLDDFSRLARIQTSTASPVENFGIDIDRDILQAVVGPPDDPELGSTIAGREGTLALNCRIDFAGLGRKCEQLFARYKLQRYRRDFAWVDQVRAVSDRAEIGRLDSLLQDALNEHLPPSLHGSPPVALEWEDIEGFSMPLLAGAVHSEVPIRAFLERRRERGGIVVEALKNVNVMVHLASEGNSRRLASAYSCIVCELVDGDGHYILAGGKWFRVEPDFVKRVRKDILSIDEVAIGFPQAKVNEHEGEYNQRAAAILRGILLDKKIIRCRGASSAIEACDVLTRAREFVHVKAREGGSKSFSHLLAQGLGSAQTFLADEGFRSRLRDMVREQNVAFASRIPIKSPIPSEFTVMFAVIGNHSGKLVESLPFLSQVSLLRTANAIRTLGMRVALTSIGRDA